MPCPRGPPVLLPFGACPVETTLFPQGLEPPRGGVPRGLQPYVEVPSEEHGSGASRALGCRVRGQVSPEGRLRRPGVAAAARAVDVDDGEGATCGHHVEGHGLARHDVHDVSNFLRGEHVRPKGNQEPAAHRCRQRCPGIHPWVRMIPMVTPLILRVHHTLRVLQAGLLEEAQDGTLGLHDAHRHCLAVKHTWGHWYAVPPHRALDVPGHPRWGVGGGAPSWLHVWTGAPRRIRITGRRGAHSRFRGTTCTRRGRPARWPLSPLASGRGGRRLLRPGRCGGPTLGLSAGCTCRRTPRRSHCPTLCYRPNRSRSRRRRRRPALCRRAGTRGQHERSGPRLG